jgi:regulator of sigma D
MLHRALFPVMVVSSLVAPQEATTSSAVEKELRQRTQELLDAVAPGRSDVWRTLLHERMIHVDENGIVRTKAQLLAELQPLPPGLEGSLQIASFHVQVHGDVAVATHEDQEALTYFGQKLDSRFRTTDTWLRTARIHVRGLSKVTHRSNLGLDARVRAPGHSRQSPTVAGVIPSSRPL